MFAECRTGLTRDTRLGDQARRHLLRSHVEARELRKCEVGAARHHATDAADLIQAIDEHVALRLVTVVQFGHGVVSLGDVAIERSSRTGLRKRGDA